MSDIRDFVMAEPLFDNHEHQHGFADVDGRKDNLTYREFQGYATADVATAMAGMDPKPDLETDEGFFSVWSFVRTTGYGEGTELACKEVTGLDYTPANADAITAALREFAADKSGREVYEAMFAQANVCGVANDCCWDSPTKLDVFDGHNHPDTFGQVLRYDAALTLGNRNQIEGFESAMDCTIQRLSDLDRALDEYTEKARQGGKLIGMKSAMPYSRRLDFENSSYAEAERAFEELMQGRGTDLKPLHDYLFHRFVQRAREFDLPVQLHTGYLAGNWGDITQGDPAPLVPVLQRYMNVRFDLFHAAWPYSEVLGAIGKAMPNVWLDMCWAWAMNPGHMGSILEEWLAGVPHNKIFAFGGDTGSPFCTVGYAAQAREGIAAVLERKVEAGEWDESTAQQVARRIMHENATEFFGM